MYAIIDGSEVFIETPSDLHVQLSTWSPYKHHKAWFTIRRSRPRHDAMRWPATESDL